MDYKHSSYTPTLSTNIAYKLQVKCKDSLGNQSSATTSNSYTLDTVAPAALLFLFYRVSSNNKSFTWKWNSVSGATHYAFRTSPNNGSTYLSWSPWTTDREHVTLTGSGNSESTWRLQVKCKDSAGNESSITTSNSHIYDESVTATLLFPHNQVLCRQ